MSAEIRVEKIRRGLRNNFQPGQRNEILAQKNVLEVTRLVKAEHSDVSNDDRDSSFFDNPYVKILIRLGRHQSPCGLF